MGIVPKPTSQEMQISGFFHWCGWDNCTLVGGMASDSHKNGYLGKHPQGAFDILLSLLFINTFNTN